MRILTLMTLALLMSPAAQAQYYYPPSSPAPVYGGGYGYRVPAPIAPAYNDYRPRRRYCRIVDDGYGARRVCR